MGRLKRFLKSRWIFKSFKDANSLQGPEMMVDPWNHHFAGPMTTATSSHDVPTFWAWEHLPCTSNFSQLWIHSTRIISPRIVSRLVKTGKKIQPKTAICNFAGSELCSIVSSNPSVLSLMNRVNSKHMDQVSKSTDPMDSLKFAFLGPQAATTYR